MSGKIKFEQDDQIGASTLHTVAEADKFNEWMYASIKPYCTGKILEIGSGIGNISNFFIRDKHTIFLSDIREGYCEALENKFKENENYLGTATIDLTDSDFDKKYSNHLGHYDSIFALNVVEHIYDDSLALENCYKLLATNGNVIILVPSYQKLFNQFDIELGHYRRYTKKTLSPLFLNSSFKIIHKQYFNFVGILGWYFSGKILKKKSIPKGQMKLYNFFVPIIKIVDKIILNSVGLSTIVVGKKSNQ